MRRIAFASAALAAAVALTGCQSFRDNFGTARPNPGPCPTALSLYEAHRLVDFEGREATYPNIGFTGEILNVSALCRYNDERADPINTTLEMRMAFGRGEAASSDSRTYRYFVAVTRRDSAVISKETLSIPVTFRPGETRVEVVQTFDGLMIPRATPTTSGGNFEILVGFELTDDQLEYNRSGQRFRVGAGQSE
jgi:hypothetical protein